MSSHPRYRLPRTVVPRRYELEITPDMDRMTFAGTVAISVDVDRVIGEVVLNAKDLVIATAELVDGAGTRHLLQIEMIEEDERVRLISREEFTPGTGQLRVGFTGVINEDLEGFYQARYTDDDGVTHTLATTQFEATAARRAFPCWDEPEYKAVFSLTLIVPEHLFVVSNTGIAATEVPAPGVKRVRFADTIVMSSYLLAYVVGRLEATDPVDVDGVPLRIVHQPGRGHLTSFALDVGAFALRYLSEYYDIPYPGDKLDLIAIPDFAFGAMENLGAVTFRDNLLIVDPDQASEGELMRIVDVIGHEIAHMWFGDLVTMKWWNGIWLNEAFASFMEMKVTDAYQPEWHRWLAFATEAGTGRSQSMDVDALETTRPIEFEVTSPEEANEMFDALTYGKGAAVLRMLEQFIGEDHFREGVEAYLRTHAFGNTETSDLWDALEAASGRPVRQIMDSWIFQGGFPVLDVREAAGAVEVSQRHFRYVGGGETQWKVPLMWRAGSDEGSQVLEEPATIRSEARPFIVNAGGHGFYRTRYDAELRTSIVDSIGSLMPLERYTLISDSRTLFLSGESPVDEFLDLVAANSGETDVVIWEEMIGGLAEVEYLLPESAEKGFESFVHDMVGPALAQVGLDVRPGDTSAVRRLRGVLIVAAGMMAGDGDVVARSAQVVDMLIGDPGAVDADVGTASIRVTAAAGSMDDFDRYSAQVEAARTPQERVRYLFTLPVFRDPAVVDILYGRILDGEIRGQDGPFIVNRLLGNRRLGATAWKGLESRWDAVMDAFPTGLHRRAFSAVRYLSQPAVAGDVATWLAEHEVPGAARSIDQQLEGLRVRVDARNRAQDTLGARFGGAS